MSSPAITVEATVSAPLENVWEMWISPEHIVQWNAASDDWHTPWAENDVRVGGKLKARMEAKDGSMGFDFAGEYTEVEPLRRLAYRLEDGRMVEVVFEPVGDAVQVTETFEAESTHPPELQRQGWQSILDHFKRHAEGVHSARVKTD